MVNYDRQMVSKKIDTITYDLDGFVADSIKKLQEIIDEYPTARISYEEIDYDSRYGMVLYAEVEETDEQLASRIAMEEKIEARNEERERQMYDRLKAKFEI